MKGGSQVGEQDKAQMHIRLPERSFTIRWRNIRNYLWCFVAGLTTGLWETLDDGAKGNIFGVSLGLAIIITVIIHFVIDEGEV